MQRNCGLYSGAAVKSGLPVQLANLLHGAGAKALVAVEAAGNEVVVPALVWLTEGG